MNEKTICVLTTYDEPLLSTLVHLMLFKLRRWPRFVLVALGLAASVAAGMIMLADGMVSGLPFLVMVLGSMLTMIGIYIKPIAVRMLTASYGTAFPAFAYTFSPEEIRIVYGEHERCYSYGYIQRMLDMSGVLFLFMKDGQVYMIRHTDIREGFEELKALLETRTREQ